MDNYPEEFTELQKKPNDELADCCDKLFEQFNGFAESAKRKAAVWPLQMMLLVLCPVSSCHAHHSTPVTWIEVLPRPRCREIRPGSMRCKGCWPEVYNCADVVGFFSIQKILEEITNADTGAPCSPQHLKKVSARPAHEFSSQDICSRS